MTDRPTDRRAAVDAIVAIVREVAGVATVAVDGHSAAGKSTFAGVLADALGAVLVHGDDFYRVMGAAERSALSPGNGARLYYDWERLRREVLEPLHTGVEVTYRPYDWERNELSDELVRVGPAESIVIEGLFVSRPELADLIDVAVLVEAPADLRRQRQRERGDASTSWLGRWDAAERWFFEQVRRPDSFDIRVGGG